MKKYIAILLFLVCIIPFAAAQITLPEGVHLELRNDTLFIVSDNVNAQLPQHVMIKQANRPNIYRRIYNDMTDDLMEDHPADDIYKSIWSNASVNPYRTPIDSITDSIYLDLRNFTVPVPGYITSKFGPRRYRYHYGVDLKLNIGDTIRSAFEGQVRVVGWDANGYGHYVVVRHSNGLETVYGHMSRPIATEGQRVASGDVLGLGGSTGRSTGPHLHFEFRYLGNTFNPELLVDFNTGKIREESYCLTRRGTFYHKTQSQRMDNQLAQAPAPTPVRTTTTTTTAQPAKKYYTVKSGDTLGAIARRNNTTVKALCKLNNIKETTILQIGRKLRVK